MDSLECEFIKVKDQLKIKSPSIGRAVLAISPKDQLIENQVIGKFFKLNHEFLLKLPKNCAGEVLWAKPDNLINLEYGEHFLTLEAQKNQKAISYNQEKSTEKFINSPMDGLFYLSSSPTSPNFVKIGDQISPGQTIGLIEVMKCFYPIKYQGKNKAKIISILVSSQTPVISTSPLFVIEPIIK
jgi:biotin carboxyl carrier protein